MSISTLQTSTDVRPAWNLEWLSPIRCRISLVALLALGFFSHLLYLHYDCPIDLSGDEAQYWDWSRKLDLNYYSKGPLIAFIIRGSCAIFGDTMPAVRYPALVLSVATSVVTYLLTKKLFDSERLALGAVFLFHLVPLFIGGSVLMTIDPPMFFCWALATYFAAIAIFDDRKWMWIAVGIAIGVGLLAKYAVPLWFIGAFGFLLFNGRQRKLPFALISLVVASLFMIPMLIWNMRHDWVTFEHIVTQTGTKDGGFDFMNVLFMIGTQIGAVGPTIAYIMTAAVVYTLLKRFSQVDPCREKLLYLAWIGLPFLLLNFLDSFRTKVQVNWPAPAYFSLTILMAYFLGTRLRSVQTWKPWRGWFYGAVVIALAVIPIAHDTSVIYPILDIWSRTFHRDMSQLDPLARVRGWRFCGQNVSEEIAKLGPGAFVLCDDYQQTAEMAFYVEGQPKTYCAGPYFADPKRLSQYDMWPDRRLDSSSPLVGRNAVYLGKGTALRIPDDIRDAFERVENVQVIPFQVNGVTVRTFKIMHCYGFKGMTMPAALKRKY